jgi:8-oxo-dGTP pyrophosphatase MutT (NUDIX family)
MKIEVSAGGIVYRKKGKACQILLLKDKNNNWTFPKGLIEDNEDKISTAQREIGEEVGLKKIKFVSELPPIGYWYRWQKDLVKKTVYYFLFEATGSEKPKPQEEEGIKETKWFTPLQALKVIGYRKTNESVLREVIEKLKI